MIPHWATVASLAILARPPHFSTRSRLPLRSPRLASTFDSKPGPRRASSGLVGPRRNGRHRRSGRDAYHQRQARRLSLPPRHPLPRARRHGLPRQPPLPSLPSLALRESTPSSAFAPSFALAESAPSSALAPPSKPDRGLVRWLTYVGRIDEPRCPLWNPSGLEERVRPSPAVGAQRQRP
jgi:hypothetical protein